MEKIIDSIKLGDNNYTKLKYSPLEMGETASKFIQYSGLQEVEKIEEMYKNALKKVSVNGVTLENELKLNQHFLKFPKELREVRIWALMEGLQSFLDSFLENPNLEEKYLHHLI
jgi:hypothetical protein